jgi:hypothetical protein
VEETWIKREKAHKKAQPRSAEKDWQPTPGAGRITPTGHKLCLDQQTTKNHAEPDDFS